MLEIASALSTEVLRTVTGRLFTDAQIRQVALHAVGKYFADLLPEPADERVARERVEEARLAMPATAAQSHRAHAFAP